MRPTSAVHLHTFDALEERVIADSILLLLRSDPRSADGQLDVEGLPIPRFAPQPGVGALPERSRLLGAFVGESDICVALDPTCGVPFGFAVTNN